jgi:beta-carotene 3-hydroxylase
MTSLSSYLDQGLGITVFGIAYMFVHDGLVHKRFPVGPIANVPYFTRVAAAHQVIKNYY